MEVNVQKQVDEILKRDPVFTGQVNIEVHLKDGKVMDVYVTNRNKVK